jgi:hypothetical protein
VRTLMPTMLASILRAREDGWSVWNVDAGDLAYSPRARGRLGRAGQGTITTNGRNAP